MILGMCLATIELGFLRTRLPHRVERRALLLTPALQLPLLAEMRRHSYDAKSTCSRCLGRFSGAFWAASLRRGADHAPTLKSI